MGSLLAAEQIIKVPISILGQYKFCKTKAILSLKQYAEKINSEGQFKAKDLIIKERDVVGDPRTLGILMHECFTEYFTELTNQLYRYGENVINETILKKLLDAALERVEAVIQNSVLYSNHQEIIDKKKNVMFQGASGYQARMLKASRHISRGDGFKASDLMNEYFKGEPVFNARVANEYLMGIADVMIEKNETNENQIWEFKSGHLTDHSREHEQIQAAAYALASQSDGRSKCVSFTILQLSEITTIPFTDAWRERVVGTYKSLLSHFKQGKVPFELMDGRCTHCQHKDRCQELNKMYTSTGIFPDTEDISALFNSFYSFKDMNEVLPEPSFPEPINETPELQESETVEDVVEISETRDTAVLDINDPFSTQKDEQSRTEGEDVEIIPDGDSNTSQVTIPVSPQIKVEDTDDDGELPDDAIGIVLQAQNQPLLLSAMKDNVLEGVIKDKFRKAISVGQILITRAKKPADSDADAIVEIREIQSFPSVIAMPFRKLTGFNIKISTSPFMYYERDRYTRTLFPTNFNANYLRLPSPNEMTKIMHLSSEGIKIGLVTYERVTDELPKMLLPYKFPISFREMGYKNMFLVGSPGKGKTNMLKILINAISQYTGTKTGNPPAIIILDNTGQFTELDTKTSRSGPIEERLWELLDMDVVRNLKRYKIIGRDGDGTHTLTLSAIDPDLLAVMFPQLPQNSSQTFQNLSLKVFQQYPNADFNTFKTVMNRILDTSDYLHSSVKNAIKTALEHGPADYFDKGTDYLLLDDMLVEGQVSTIQVDHIPSAMPVLLYLLMMIHKKKILEKDETPLIMVLDEAHDIFPKSGAIGYEKEYVRMITNKVRSLARTGRKRKLGLIFASQQPHDIDQDIVGVFQTFFILGLQSASTNWVKDTLGREYVDQVMQLETGYARVLSREIHGDVLVPLFIPKAPNKHEE